MCNLYSQTTSQEAVRRLFAGQEFWGSAVADHLGNLAPQPEIYPDYVAPIVRNGAQGLDMVLARWGMPTPPQFLVGKKTDRGVTNIRNTRSPHWRRWLGPAHRCLVPMTTFAEPNTVEGGNCWFAMADQSPAFFAGLHVPGWRSTRKIKDGETVDDLFGFLTTTPNAEVASVHPKAMPVILTSPADWALWLAAPWEQASSLQRPLHDAALQRL